MDKQIRAYIEEYYEELLQILRDLCAIPAPSHHEEERAGYCRRYLEGFGAEDVTVDEAQNVVFPWGCEGSDAITVFAAHTDTVFPDTEPYPYREDEEKIYCPGVGDDTACVAVLLMMAKFFVMHNIRPAGGFLFVCNSCEEGLGNLKGTRQLFADYAGRIRQFVTFDSTSMRGMVDRSVGSHRYEVTVRTEGGHSFNAFGNRNAIHALAELVSSIYAIEVPHDGDSKTTYNVGDIHGGTSVNTIAQSATMLCEYRSDSLACLSEMEDRFAALFAAAQSDEVAVEVTRIGERPCAGGLDPTRQTALSDLAADTVAAVIGEAPARNSGSTDCNIPHSLGIPAVCVGTMEGGGPHTREEWLYKESLRPGLEIALRLGLALGTAR
ncbi:MAG: M20/M25/M40 family metallo-hydrolase [Clostridia bacterium]|nr:M20/M25/M40 family metallo-hydrolase [Clostridia bacterium]